MLNTNAMLETVGEAAPFPYLDYASGQYSFIASPEFAPTWPTKGNLQDKALALLMDGRLIDHPEFEDITGSWRLGAVIFQLRGLGWPIETLDIPSPTQDTPDRVIALYRLDGKYISQALAMKGGANGT